MSSPVSAPSEHLTLTLADISVDESRNVSRFFPVPPEKIRDLADNIKQYGRLLEPVIVEAKVQGISGYPNYVLVAGYQRMKALALLASEGVIIPIAATPKPYKADAAEINIDENLKRNDLSLMDTALIACGLKKRGMKQYDIAKRLGKKPAWVSCVMKFAKLRPEIQARIHSGEIGFALARELCLKTEPQQDKALGDLNAVREFGKLAVENPPTKKMRERAAKVKRKTIRAPSKRVIVINAASLFYKLRYDVRKVLAKRKDARVVALRSYLDGKMPLAKLLGAMGGK